MNNQIKYDIDKIFPNCIHDYCNNTNDRTKIYNDINLQRLCINIKNKFSNSKTSCNFLYECKKLVLYLDYINSIKSSQYIKTSCIFFNYILKVLLKDCQNSVQKTEDAYKVMNDEINKNSFKNVQKRMKLLASWTNSRNFILTLINISLSVLMITFLLYKIKQKKHIL
ncbi:variable surface protein [Plasmodium gonderi]|uniref:Variable surface protein n=1 Tax=Plasmodium gonderi TaxID=77519 RepID=A0A1Y1JQD5_PLAGO|nr:variable surface protein [Plasmodium gonderi]GAW84711.1 variable surface protein [Plasmodium gonderi]